MHVAFYSKSNWDTVDGKLQKPTSVNLLFRVLIDHHEWCGFNNIPVI